VRDHRQIEEYVNGRARVAELRARLIVGLRAAGSVDIWQACARHVAALPDDDPRLELLASFRSFDLEVMDDYFHYHVGCDSTGYTAVNRFLDRRGRTAELSIDELVSLILVDALAFEATLPEMREARMESSDGTLHAGG
jgi:hypothetical protein